MLSEINHIHFVGIGGAGLSAIAKVLIEQGKVVSGSDQSESATTAALEALGARVFIGHRAEQVGDAGLVVASSAVREHNPELVAARERGIPVVKRDALLGELMQDKIGVAVAGTHGKTTTTAMTAFCLSELGLDPTFIVGGILVNYDTNARAGRGPHFVVEADEYDYMFLGLKPKHAVVTNVEFDHPDCFPDEQAMVKAFQSFLSLPSLAHDDSKVLVCGDSPNARSLRAISPRVISYGFAEFNDYRVIDPQSDPRRGAEFVVAKDRRSVAVVQLGLPGRHNILNACGVLALCDQLRLDLTKVSQALAQFRGVYRRFEIKGETRGVTVVDDYAHHPTEIRATLAAARERFGSRRIWAVFQPHTYSRTRALLEEFAQAFTDADRVVVTEIFASRETDTLGISGAHLVERMSHPGKCFAATLAEAADVLIAHTQPEDVVILLGAGDINTLSARLLIGNALFNAPQATLKNAARP